MANPFESICVLVVEDDPVQFEIMEIYLRKLGIKKLLAANNGNEAMTLLLSKDHAIHAIFTDLDMPVMDGVDFIEQLRGSPQLADIGVAMTTDNLTNLQNPPEAEIKLRAYLEHNRVLPLVKDNISPKTLGEALKVMTGL